MNPEIELHTDFETFTEDHTEITKQYKRNQWLYKFGDIKVSVICHMYESMNWIRELEMSEIQRETLNEYIAEMENLNDKIDRFMNRIDEMYQSDRYNEKVSKLRCFKGIDTFAAMTIQVETADFERFPSAKAYASYTGLTTGEHSSGDKNNRIGITKQGNTVIRKTLVECAQALVKGNVYAKKSQRLKSRQKGMDVNIIVYADKATERLKKKYQKLIERNVPRNKAIVAIARELACFNGPLTLGTQSTNNRVVNCR